MNGGKLKRKLGRTEENIVIDTHLDFIFDVFFWIPELLLLPFRMVFWLVRGVGKVIGSLFDGI